MLQAYRPTQLLSQQPAPVALKAVELRTCCRTYCPFPALFVCSNPLPVPPGELAYARACKHRAC